MIEKRSVRVRQGDNYIAYFVTYKPEFYNWVAQFWKPEQLRYTPPSQIYAETKSGCWMVKESSSGEELESLKIDILKFELGDLLEKIHERDFNVSLFDQLFTLHQRVHLYWDP